MMWFRNIFGKSERREGKKGILGLIRNVITSLSRENPSAVP
jgi:hypothetical protein